MLSFLRIQTPRFEPDREVNKWLPTKLTLRQNNGFCEGEGGQKSGFTHTKQWHEPDPEMLNWLKKLPMLPLFSQ
jgi:hypothetical protein